MEGAPGELEYVRSVFEDLKRGDDETICLEEFKKQLNSLSVTEVGLVLTEVW